jgi:signal transduction histidine kinase
VSKNYSLVPKAEPRSEPGRPENARNFLPRVARLIAAFQWLKAFQFTTDFRKLREFLVPAGLEPAERASRIIAIEKNVVLPLKAMLIFPLTYYFFFSRWIDQVSSTREVAFETIRGLFLFYVAFNGVVGLALLLWRNPVWSMIRWVVFVLGLFDGLLLAAITFISGGFDSILYWIFLGLILRNAISLSTATLQIALNLCVVVFYLFGGLLDMAITDEEISRPEIQIPTKGAPRNLTYEGLEVATRNDPTEPFLLRLIVLTLWAACCYGVQSLMYKQWLAERDAEEFGFRQGQLQAAGRLAAEIAHRIKNPLAIINNAAYSLQRGISDNRETALEQIAIIREEVDKADRIITELMGYAAMAEGKVERLSVAEELERATNQVFPAGANYLTLVHTEINPVLPSLLMQRGHLSEIFVNLLQNAREAMNGEGSIRIRAWLGQPYSVFVSISDSGPGIPPDKLQRVFEPYFTTKPKGTGLGLAIVKHNVELYGGRVQLESQEGSGTAFTLEFPAKPLLKVAK